MLNSRWTVGACVVWFTGCSANDSTDFSNSTPAEGGTGNSSGHGGTTPVLGSTGGGGASSSVGGAGSTSGGTLGAGVAGGTSNGIAGMSSNTAGASGAGASSAGASSSGGTGGSQGSGGGSAQGGTSGSGSGGSGAACTYSSPTGVSSAPPYTGSDAMDPSAAPGLTRSGPLKRFANWAYTGDVLAAFRQKRGFVDPSCQTGLLSDPYRDDGTALNTGYVIPSNFSGHIPVFTEGNNWPFIGPNQPQPPHGNLQADAGIYLLNGKLTITQRPLLVPGEIGATVTNKTNYGILISSGSYPGDEQPGQVMTPVAAGQTAPMPIPPKGWYPDGSGNPRVPELYISVAGLDPMDAVGWHISNTNPDYGTPGFAYTLGGKYTKIQGQASQYLFMGFNRNEGYDPILSADPGYGIELFMTPSGGTRTLVAITDINTTGARSARQDLWAASQFNPQQNVQGGLSAFPNGPEGTKFEYEFVTHDVAQKALQAHSGVITETDSL